jgi:hypothetical protein
VQYLIDTNTDDPSEIYAIASALAKRFETVPSAAFVANVTSSDAPEAPTPIVDRAPLPVPPPPPPPPSVPPVAVDDPDVDTEETVTPVTVPPPPVPLPPGPPASVELDINGTPWNPSIHAKNKAKTIAGTWKNRRGTAPVASVPAVPPVAPPVASDSAVSMAVPVPPPVTPQAAPPTAVPASVPAAAPPVTPPPTGTPFQLVMRRLNKLSRDQQLVALATAGIEPAQLAAIINDLPMIAALHATIDGMGA